LAAFGVQTVGDLAALPEADLVATLGRAAGRHLHALAWNRDDRDIEPDHVVKSIGHEETYPSDIFERATLRHEIVRLADRVATRLRKGGCAGRTVQLKLRYADFRTITRSRTLAAATNLAADIAGVAGELLEAVPIDDGVRLLGVSVQQLTQARVPATDGRDGTPGAAQQGFLFDSQTELPEEGRDRQVAVERSLDEVRARFGPGAIGPGAVEPGVTNSLHREGSERSTR
jgi:DNA polymerase-4